MTFYTKIKWILGILMIFILILATNLIDRNNFIRMKDSVVTIYEDRIVANDLIFDMFKLIQEKEIALIKSDTIFFNSQNSTINKSILDLLNKYELTKLTQEEKMVFDTYKSNYTKLIGIEQNQQLNEANKGMLLEYIFKMENNLGELSKIQLNEGRRQMFISKKAIDSVELFTQIEIYFLIFLAVMIHIIIMYNPK